MAIQSNHTAVSFVDEFFFVWDLPCTSLASGLDTRSRDGESRTTAPFVPFRMQLQQHTNSPLWLLLLVLSVSRFESGLSCDEDEVGARRPSFFDL